MRWLKRVAEMLSSGSAAEREQREAGAAQQRGSPTTATIWIVLAIVSGISSTTLLICWMSVLA